MKSSLKIFVGQTLELVILLLFVVVPIRLFLFQPFVVSGESMAPGFHSGDYLIIDEFSKNFNALARGEVVVFRPPNNRHTFFIKRIIGLPGETVEIKSGIVRIYNGGHPEGFILEEDYLADHYTAGEVKVVLGADEYFVLGDNRSASFDSRTWGEVRGADIVGRAFLRLLPLTRVALFLP